MLKAKDTNNDRVTAFNETLILQRFQSMLSLLMTVFDLVCFGVPMPDV